MSRSILPFPPSYGGSEKLFRLPPQPDPPPSPPSKAKYAKRGRITIIACLPCRKTKSKCDGERPMCSKCLDRDRRCQYDMTDEQRSLPFLRGNVERLEREKRELQSALLTLQQHCVKDNAAGAMHILGTNRNLQAVSRNCNSCGHSRSSHDTIPPQNVRPSPQLFQYQDLIRVVTSAAPMKLDKIIRRLRLGEDVASILSSDTAGNSLQDLSSWKQDNTVAMEVEPSSQNEVCAVKGDGVGLLQEEQRQSNARGQPISRWSSVTDDNGWVEHLLSLYFIWKHRFFQDFPESLFRADMASGRTRYCSSLLVNAICAAGCFLSSHWVQQDPNNLRTASVDFYREATRLLSCLLTACTIYINKLPSISATSHLAAACNSFQDLSEQSEYARNSLNTIRGLVQKWKIILRLEVEAAMYRYQNASAVPDHGAATPGSTGCDAPPHAASTSFGLGLDKRESHWSNPPWSEIMQTQHLFTPRRTHQEGLRGVDHCLFTPFLSQPTPLLGPVHSSSGRKDGGDDMMWNYGPKNVPQGFDGLDFVDNYSLDLLMGHGD